MTSKKVEGVLREIFGNFVGSESWQASWPVLHATYDDLVALAELLANNAGEEELQRLLTVRPQLIVGGLGSGGHGNELAFLTKPQIGTQYRADFALLSYGQGGGDISLIEIERASDALFTRAGTPARRLQSAMGQVRAWDAWIRKNQRGFVQDVLERCKQLPVFPGRSRNGSFLFVEFPRLENLWNEFGGCEIFPVRYYIIIGRWSRLSESERSKLLYANRIDNSVQQVRTFEQLARSAHLSHMLSHY